MGLADFALKEGCEARCPGCAHRGLSLRESLAQKENWLKARLAPWREAFAPLQSVAEAGRWDYREKIRLSTVWDGNTWQFGLISREELIPIPRCPVHSERARAMIRLLAETLPPGPVFPMAFYIQSGAQVTLVLKTRQMPELTWLSTAVEKSLADLGIEGLWLHLHPAAGRRMFAKRGWHLLRGRPRSRDGSGLVYGPSAFQQLIPTLYERALDEAEAFLAPLENTPVIDLYCGIGATLARWIRHGALTVGVELGGEAVECARQNAPQALILRGKCKDRVPQLTEWLGRFDRSNSHALLYVNPPRTGIEPEVLEWVAGDFRPARIAYLSCSAGTLRRDLNSLEACGYHIERITPYDFFPQTYHVETLVLLQRIH